MTLDANFLIGLITGGILAWILHWLLYRDRTGAAEGHNSHDLHGTPLDPMVTELEAARAELASLNDTHAGEIASCEEKLADAEAEIGLLRAKIEVHEAPIIEVESAESDVTVLHPKVDAGASELESAPVSPAAVESAAVAAPVETAAPPPVGPPDDLKKVEGIGPKIEGILHAAGITTFSKLAGTSVAALEKIVREDGGIRVAYPDTWPQQAGLAAADKWDELTRFQDTLKGGRRRPT